MATPLSVGSSLGPDLIDAISEAVVWTAGPAERAEVIRQLLDAVVDAVRWRLEPAGDVLEEGSLHHLQRAVARHQARMQDHPQVSSPAG